MARKVILFLLAIFVFSCSGKPFTVKTITGGKAEGRNFSTAADLSEIVNRNIQNTRIKLTLEVTSDKYAAVKALINGELDFVILSAKDTYDISRGYGKWDSLDNTEHLRALFSVQYDMLTFIASGMSGIYSFPAIHEKTINIGPDGSALQLNARDVIASYNMTLDDFEHSEDLVENSAGLFRDGQLDAFFCLESHPSPFINELSMGRIPINIIPLGMENIDKLIKAYPYYTKTEVPVELYSNIEKRTTVYTVGIKNVLISSKNVDDKTAYSVTRELFENFDMFRALDPCYMNITKKNMLQNFSLKVHHGAEKYYEETGLAKYYRAE